MAISTADTAKKRAIEFVAYVGQSRLPTTLLSVRPGPGKSVCF
jgi:hypothetical protein